MEQPMMQQAEFMDDFFLSAGNKTPSLMELPFAIQEIQWQRAQEEKVYVQGRSNGNQEVSVEIDLWRLELPVEGKPKFLVHQTSGAWMELRKPRDSYLETMKVVVVAAHFLIFAKQSPHSSKGDVWRYVRKECSEFKIKPNQKDLAEAFLLLQSIVTSDPKLQASPIIPQFFPNLSKKLRSQAAKDKKKPRLKRECSPVSETPIRDGRSVDNKITSAAEQLPSVGDTLKGASSSQGPRMRSLAEFSIEADLPLSQRLTPVQKKRKPGRPTRRSSARKGKGTDDLCMEGDEDWVDEPDVCAFCDDGVEGSERLLCCDGICMRSFHPTIESGWQNKCQTLRLTRAAVSVETWICPNCEVGQHQCFECGKLGNSNPSTDVKKQEVFVCGAKQCKRFYHPSCVAKYLVPEAAQNNLACRIKLNLETFSCPLHKCASCNLDEDKEVPSLCLIKCRRCPVAWHDKCLPPVCKTQLWQLQNGQSVMYCGNHTLDPVLLTPAQNHVTFPSVETNVIPNGSKFSGALLSYKTCQL